MKPSYILNILLGAALLVVCIKLVTNNNSASLANNAAVENTDTISDGKFHEFNVIADTDSLASFTFFANGNHGVLLCAGDSTNFNAMTIGWGAVGTLWGRWRPTVTVYVAENRYTREFLEKYDYFTVMRFPDNRVVDYMGTHSGRDGDKVAALGLHTLFTENGTPYFEEANLVMECKMMYGGDKFSPEHFRCSIPSDLYENFPAGPHYMYMGEVVSAMKK